MKFPKQKAEIIELAMDYRIWLNSNGNHDLFPTELSELDDRTNYIQIGFGTVFHGVLVVLVTIFKSIGLWPCVAALCSLRIATDEWSYEPRQCGYNRAFTLLGLYRLRRKNLEAAISALNESWQVYPCPHNMSFGLSLSLAQALEPFEEASEAVKNYKEVLRAFKASQRHQT